ncbi:hypothetical protein L531_4187 [Bordetella bronchiseptica MO275]|nr:hypothetical protein L531_4187 [Bordetella bronchiseptica MO275]
MRPGGCRRARFTGRAAPRPYSHHRQYLCGAGIGLHPQPRRAAARRRPAGEDPPRRRRARRGPGRARGGAGPVRRQHPVEHVHARPCLAARRRAARAGRAGARHRTERRGGGGQPRRVRRRKAGGPRAAIHGAGAAPGRPGRAAAHSRVVRARRRAPRCRPDRLPERRVRAGLSRPGRTGGRARTRAGAGGPRATPGHGSGPQPVQADGL